MPAELWVSRSGSGHPASGRSSTSLKLARWCAGNDWPVHPLAPGRKTPVANCRACAEPGHTRANCSCLRAGRWCHGFHAATLDDARIEHCWTRNPALGVGVACGPARLVVIDIDAHGSEPPHRDRILPGIPIGATVDLRGLRTGFHSLAVLAALRGEPSPADDHSTLRVRTPSGGMHVWYRATDGRRWQCSTGSGKRALAWQVDIRAHGGYIVAPGTTTTAGRYEPWGQTRHPAPLPPWLAQELQRTGHLPSSPHAPTPPRVPPRARPAVLEADGGLDKTSRLLNALLTDVASCAQVAEGAGFTEKLNRAAYTIGGLIAAGHLPGPTAEEALTKAATAARPGQNQRSGQIIRSGMAAGAQRPLNLGSHR